MAEHLEFIGKEANGVGEFGERVDQRETKFLMVDIKANYSQNRPI